MAVETGRPVRLAVMGAGLIGKRHIERVLTQPDAELAAIVDPSPAAEALAEAKGAPWFPSFAAMLAAGARPEGAIVATPNQVHADNGLECIAAGVPALVEKPLADDIVRRPGSSRPRRSPAFRFSPATTGATIP